MSNFFTIIAIFGVFSPSLALASTPIPTPGTILPENALVVRVQQASTEPKLKSAILALQDGTLDMKELEPLLRVAVQNQMAAIRQRLAALGALKSIQYVGPQNGSDVYQVEFENGVTAWAIQMSPNGKIGGLWFN